MAAVRCKQSKLRFFIGALLGKEWREQDLFHPEDTVKHKANRMLQQYKAEQSQVGVSRCESLLWLLWGVLATKGAQD